MNGIYFHFPDNLETALGWMVLHILWQATLIGLVARVVLAIMRRHPARSRYRVAISALAAILLAALTTFIYSYEDSASAPASDPAIISNTGISIAPPARDLAPPESGPPVPGYEVLTDYAGRHLPSIVTVWFFGMALFMLRFLGNIGYVHYLKTRMNFPAEQYWQELLDQLAQKSGLARTIRLVESALVRTPMVLGYFKPLILFPVGMINRLEPQEAEAILAHELAHILRHDYLFNILQTFVEALFYFHPAVWWLSGVIRYEREVAADDLAIRLTDNPVVYAKTLVLVQDAAFTPVSLSPAFSGVRKNQLLERIQHILNVQQSKNSAMEKIIVTCGIILVIIGIGYTQTRNTTTITEHPAQLAAGRSGVWQGTIDNGKVCMTLASRTDSSSWMNGACFLESEFSTLPVTEADFSVTREAGTITFRGKFEGKEGYGRFTFTPDPTLTTWLDKQGIGGVDNTAMMHLFFANTGKNYVEFLKKAGYDKISGDELASLAIHGVSEQELKEYIEIGKDFGGNMLSIDDLIELKIHGVDRAYVDVILKTGFPDLTLDNISEAKIHELSPEYIRQCRDMGFSNLDFEEIMGFKIHGITAEYVRECKNMGFPNLNADEIMAFKIHGITAEYVQTCKNMGFSNLSADEVMNFKIHEMTPEYLKGLKEAGLTSLSADEALNMRIHGVTPAAIADLRKMGFTKLTPDDIINLQIHQINQAFLNDMQQLGFKDLSVDDAVNLKIHGITRDYMQELNTAGFKSLSVDDAVNCKIHEVSPALIKEFNQLGFSNIAVDDAVNLKIHDVTPVFIRSMREKGFKDLSLEEYIGLKVQYGDKMK